MTDRMSVPDDGQPHVVVVGAGFAGLACAKELGNTNIRVTVIDRRNYHLFVPLLYQVATAALSPADIAEPIRRIVNRCPNVSVLLGEVTGIDAGSRHILLSDGNHVPYDRLVLATGSTHSYFGHDDWEALAPGLKTIEDARRIRTRLLLAFEQAEMSPAPEEQRRLTTIVVVGGGPTGVEMAGAVAELAKWTLARDFRRIRPADARIVLIEAGPRLLPAFPEPLSAYTERALRRLGVSVLTGTPVDSVTGEGVTAGGRLIPSGTVIWGAGVRASPAGCWLGVETDRAGRVRVARDLSVPGFPGIYALGDTALALDDSGHPLPGLAQVAKQQGRHLGRQLAAAMLRGRPMEPFRFKDRGNMATIGRNAAVADFGRMRLKGFPAWMLWAIVHVWLLVGFEKRARVTLQWLWRYLTFQRGARLITGETTAPLAAGETDQARRREAGRAG
jgi:NADH dehydrogenase